MRMETLFGLRMEQKMKLAPQIIQSIEILQLSLLALEERIQTELEENPVLEMEAPVTETVETTDGDGRTGEEVSEDFGHLADLDQDWREYFAQSSSRSIRSVERDKKLDAMQNTAARGMSLQDHLLSQMAFIEIGPRKKEIAENIICNLDNNGYLQYPLEEIVGAMGGTVTQVEAEEVLKLVQSMDPPGVGARTLEECLLLQLSPEDECSDLARVLVTSHLDDIRANRFPKIAKDTGRSLEEVKRTIELVLTLNPKPGALYDTTEPAYILPDVIVEERNGEYEVRLEETGMPRLIISPFYRNLLRRDGGNPQTRDYVRKKIQAARWLIDSIEQRRNTLLRVARATVDSQREFMIRGVAVLKPLRMQDIARRVGVHVSTVSRAIADKYMQTPQGIFEMKYFFTGGTPRGDGDMASWNSVKQRIRQLIEVEDKRSPLSDEEIASRLTARSIDVSRRTVTKYRKAMGIPSSRRRRIY